MPAIPPPVYAENTQVRELSTAEMFTISVLRLWVRERRGAVIDRPALDSRAVPLPALGDPADPARGAVRRPALDVIEERAGHLGRPAVTADELVELVAVED